MGKYRGSKSPTVRLQTGRPEATRARISEAMRRISEPMRPAAMVETRDLGSGPASRASATRSRQVSWISMGVTMPGSDPAFQGSGGTMPPDLYFPGARAGRGGDRGVIRYGLVGRCVLPFEASPPGPLSTSWRGGIYLQERARSQIFPTWALPLHEVERDRG